MERRYYLLNTYGNRFGAYVTPDEAWREADRMNEMWPRHAPHTVVGLVPVPRPVPPRPVADIGGTRGCYFQSGRLWGSNRNTVAFGQSDNILAAADLWKRRQEWIANGGGDDE